MHEPVIERSLYLLSELYDKDIGSIAGMTIGERDAGLMQFREWIFGPRLINVSRCPYCSALMEWESDIKDLMLQEGNPGKLPKIMHFEKEGLKVDFRLPNSFDIMEASSDPLINAEPSKFISKCILNVRKDGKDMDSQALPPEILTMMEQKMSDEDPMADIKMILNCPECKKQWEAPFDILSYLWMEIDNWAKRLLQEVTTMARAFGWSEKEILGLSHQRRRMYLEMIS